jgi:hypothetical protein
MGGTVGLGDDRDDLMVEEQGLQRRDGEVRGPEEQHFHRR